MRRGKIPFHNKSIFENHLGIEVTPQALEFARKSIGLNAEEDGSGINRMVSVAAFWHSLEHMTPESIKGIMTVLNRHSATDTRIIVSVPNSGSFQFFIFKENFAYYDPQNHIQQFSVQSLNRLMDTYGFRTMPFFCVRSICIFRLPPRFAQYMQSNS